MIGLNFYCVDNTGAFIVKCIKIYKALRLQPGLIVLVTVKKLRRLNGRVKKGQMYKAIIVRLNKNIVRFTGFSVKYSANCVILLKKAELMPLGTRIFGSIFYELRIYGYMKMVSLSQFLL